MQILSLFFFVLTSLGAQAANDLSAETRLVLRSISERYLKLRNWEAKFSQETFSVGLGKGTYNEGRFIFSYPNKFRYSLMRPENTDFISNGREAWFAQYKDGRDKAAYVRHFTDVSKTELDRYLLLLRGIDTRDKKDEAKLIKDFDIVGKATKTELQLALSPKSPGDLSKVEIIFKNLEDYPYKAILTDALGNTTTIILSTHKKLKSVAPTEFKADFPKDSKIEKL